MLMLACLLFIWLLNLFAVDVDISVLYRKGNDLLRQSRPWEAIDMYHQAIAVDSSMQQLYLNLGHAYLVVDAVDDAILAFQKAVSLGNTSRSNFNLAVAYQTAFDFQSAIVHYLHALDLDLDNRRALYNLGVLYQETGLLSEAKSCYSTILNRYKSDEEYPKEAHLNLCNIFLVEATSIETLACYREVLEHAPNYVRAMINMASVYWSNDENMEALSLYKAALRLEPENRMAVHGIRALSDEIPDTNDMATVYVTELFDSYSFSFEASLASLQYSAHTVVAEATTLWYKKLWSQNVISTVHILDVGAGTGLVCPLLKKLLLSDEDEHQTTSKMMLNITGVDLSSKMLLKARDKNCYDDLLVDDLIGFLESQNTVVDSDRMSTTVDIKFITWDIILASDVFMYLGDLSRVFEAVQALFRLRRSFERVDPPIFAFTIEDLNGRHNSRSEIQKNLNNKPLISREFSLQSSGRHGHSADYIRRLIAEHGLQLLEQRQFVPRLDRGHSVDGYLFVLTL